jgi:hypothetical protein
MEITLSCGFLQTTKDRSIESITSHIIRLLPSFAKVPFKNNLLPSSRKYGNPLFQPAYGYGGPTGNEVKVISAS